MDNIKKRLEHIKWLKSVGIEYYCSLEEKDSKNSLNKIINQNNTKGKLLKTAKSINKDKIIQNKTEIQDVPKITSVKKNKVTESFESEDIKISLDSRKLADKASNIEELNQQVQKFSGCPLKDFANKTVFSDGVKDAEILIIGEAPGAKEDETGIPFCGESGILLDAMLNTIGISRKTNAYITNTIFWRPPANRRPTTEEIEICRPFVEKHIFLKQPKLIILVGGTAIASLLGKKTSISEVRENSYSYKNQYLDKPIHTTALFHPAYLLRQPMQKKATWYDLLKIKDMLKNWV